MPHIPWFGCGMGWKGLRKATVWQLFGRSAVGCTEENWIQPLQGVREILQVRQKESTQGRQQSKTCRVFPMQTYGMRKTWSIKQSQESIAHYAEKHTLIIMHECVQHQEYRSGNQSWCPLQIHYPQQSCCHPVQGNTTNQQASKVKQSRQARSKASKNCKSIVDWTICRARRRSMPHLGRVYNILSSWFVKEVYFVRGVFLAASIPMPNKA